MQLTASGDSVALGLASTIGRNPRFAAAARRYNGHMADSYTAGGYVVHAASGKALLRRGGAVAFLLGKELQTGFLQWREGRRDQ